MRGTETLPNMPAKNLIDTPIETIFIEKGIKLKVLKSSWR